MADWKTFTFEIPGKDLLAPIREILETLLIFLEILKTILETIKAFLIDFGNPLRALIEALIRLIEELFESLKASGAFAYFDIPNPAGDPDFRAYRGGFPAFLNRFKASLVDSKDFNRPQPRPGSSKGGFVILAVTAPDILALIEKYLALIKFFGQAWSIPRLEAPANLKVAAIGAGGDVILDAAAAFTDGPINAIQVQWTLPGAEESSDPGFGDAFTRVAAEFIPSKWVIERAVDENPASARIELGDMGDATKVGLVSYTRKSDLPAGDRGRFSAEQVERKETLVDEYQEPILKFQRYTVIDGTSIEQIFGALGKFRYIDTDVEPGKVYYYRVRSFSGTLDVNTDGTLKNPVTDVKKLGVTAFAKQGKALLTWKWPGKNVVMGKASKIIPATVPPDLGGYDVIASLRRLFLTAFCCDFHLPSLDTDTFDTSSGRPTGATGPTAVGKGSLEGLGDALIQIASYVVVDVLGSAGSIYESWNPETNPFIYDGKPPKMPWQDRWIIREAARLADIVASAMMALPSTVYTYRSLVSSLPKGPIDGGPEPTTLDDKNTVDELTLAFTDKDSNTVTDEEADNYGTVTLEGAKAFYQGYNDTGFRLNILAVINYIKTFTLGGTPPDWISISPLRDIIPWSAQLLYDILDKIDALLAAFAGIIDEIKAFIDLLIQKIETLERFIQFLIDILNFIESFAFNVTMLVVPSVDGDVSAWIDAIDSAGGDIPVASSTGDLAAGIGLAYVAPNIEAFTTAFSVIFGAS